MPSLDTGGAERTTVDVAQALTKAGFVALVATRGGRMTEELARTGAEWIALPVDRKSPLALLANARRIARLIRTRNIALVHARSRAPAWSALWAARLTGVPFVTTHHGIYNAKSRLKRLYNSVMARGDAVIANSQWTADHIAREYGFTPRRLVVIPRGVDFARFDPAQVTPARVAAMRARFRAGQGDIVVLLPGRLTRWKGQAVLIEAAARLKGAGLGHAMRVVLAGDAQGRSDYESELEARSAEAGLGETVTIAGHVLDMPAAYRAADIVVSASTDPEAFGRIAAEAGAMERPVIASDHGGSREIVLHARTGLLVPPGDPAALAAALETMIAMGPEGRQALGRAARAHIARNFTVERMCADTLALYRELLNGPA